MLATKTAHILIRSLRAADMEIRDYSGHGMHGARCLAIESNDSIARVVCRIIEASRDLSRDESDLSDLLAVLDGTRSDSMGHGRVYYWPAITGTFGDDDAATPAVQP